MTKTRDIAMTSIVDLHVLSLKRGEKQATARLW